MDTIMNIKMKKTITSKTAILMVAVLVAGFASPSQALVYWSSSSGSADTFNWSNGGSDNSLFGEPNVVGDKLIFTPDNFMALTENGTPAVTADRLEVIITAKPGFAINSIKVTETGSYGIDTQGMVSVGGTMFLTNLIQYEVLNGNLESSPQAPMSSGQGLWSAEVVVQTNGWQKIRLVMDNNLMGISSRYSTNFIEKYSVIIEVPEPATVALLGIGSMIMIRRKNKKIIN